MKLSPFNPIRFYNAGSKPACTAHVFATTDYIIFELLHGANETPGQLTLSDANTDEMIMELAWTTYPINDCQSVSFYEFRGLNAGEYVISFGVWQSNIIHVTDNLEALRQTVLLQYAVGSNTSRSDVYQKINGRLRYFEMRLPGGFKDEDWNFLVENEQFVTDRSDIVELSAVDALEKTLTIGRSAGVTSWCGEKLSHILACGLIYVDGERYSYTGEKEITAVNAENSNGNKFVYSVTLRKAAYVNAEFEREIDAVFRKIPTVLRKVNQQLRLI